MNPVNAQTAQHNIILSNRSRMEITGVDDVVSFDDANITVKTPLGTMAVEGKGLHIINLNIDKGELSLEGSVNGVFYYDTPSRESKGGFWARVFK